MPNLVIMLTAVLPCLEILSQTNRAWNFGSPFLKSWFNFRLPSLNCEPQIVFSELMNEIASPIMYEIAYT